MMYPHRSETPIIGIELPIVGYVACPANDDGMIPITDCHGCELFDVIGSTETIIKCRQPDDNRNLRDVIRNKEEIIAAVIRGPAGYDLQAYYGATIRDWDKGVP